MLKGITMQELMGMVAEIEKTKADYIVPNGQMGMTKDLAIRIPNTGDFTLTSTAHGQIADKLQIPRAYYDRMKEKDPVLLATNVNHWLKSEANANDRRMVRTVGNTMRAYLSEKFFPLDNIHLMGAVIPVLRDSKTEIRSANLTEHKLYLQVVLPQFQGEVKKGDIVRVGVNISNSEVGFGQWQISTFLERLACLNGAVRSVEFKRRHVGRRLEANEQGMLDMDVWSRETIQADINAITLKARDTLKASLSEGAFQKQLEDLRRADGIEIPTKKLDVAVKNVTRRLRLNDAEGEGVLAAFLEEGNFTGWGLANAVTRQAHETENYDRNIELQTAGGRLIDLGEGEWKTWLREAA